MKWHNLLIFLLLMVASCKVSSADLEGEWSRVVADSDLGVNGNEKLSIDKDSTFKILNDLTFQYSDSIFECSFRFNTEISGRWQESNDRLLFLFNPQSYSFDTIPGDFKLKSLREDFPDSMLDEMKSNLVNGMDEYYKNVYMNYADEGMSFDNISVTDHNLTMFQDNVCLSWSR